MKIIAEIAQYHDGSLGRAHAMIDALATTGVSAVKFQTHIAEYESSIYEPWRVKFSYQDETRYDYWKRMEFSKSAWIELKTHAEERGLEFISSPFSLEGAEMLENIGISTWKLASGEIGNKLLTSFLLSTHKPIICSSGMSTWSELDDFVLEAKARETDLTILQCTSKYPTAPRDVGLNNITAIADRYQVKSGLSDHSGTIYPALAATVLGAACIEVHACMSRQDYGPDVSSSLTIEQIRDMCNGIHMIEEMLSHPVDKDMMADELDVMRKTFTKSLCAARDIAPDTVLTREDLIALKPLRGIPVSELDNVVGKKNANKLERYEVIQWKDLT